MKCYLGLGSNLGDRRAHLERALTELTALSERRHLRVSALYENPALLPDTAPPDWNRNFLNLACEIDVALAPAELLAQVKRVEAGAGRSKGALWAPRELDIDILHYGDLELKTPELEIPHPGISRRGFVLDPLKDLLPGRFLEAARLHPDHAPAWMGIVNVTPDSFSDGGRIAEASFGERLQSFEEHFVAWVDVGGESTRPRAQPITWQEDWRRLEPYLQIFRDRYQGLRLRPRLSLDTRHFECAERALALGVDAINDVSGLADPRLPELLAGATCDYVLMHSLSVPANPALVLEGGDPWRQMLPWFERRLDILSAAGVSRDRVMIDPGIGFGKDRLQSLRLLRELGKFHTLGCRVLVGHSRKSFMAEFTTGPVAENSDGQSARDWESVGVSLALIAQGADTLRVHRPDLHVRAYRGFSQMRNNLVLETRPL